MGENNVITIALAKGRLGELSIDLLERCGVDCSSVKEPSRKLVFHDDTGAYRFLQVKPSDVPTYVDYGVADIGIVGKDTLLEENRPLYEMLDLGFGKCRLAIAGYPRERRPESVTASNRRVATKYANIARNFYAARGETIEIIKLNGSVELGPVIGLSDEILDIVETGGTLRANGLEVLEVICPVSARLVVNRVSLKTKRGQINSLIARMRQCLLEEENKC